MPRVCTLVLFIREVSLFQGLLNCARTVLVEEKVSLLERCPHFQGCSYSLERGCTVAHNNGLKNTQSLGWPKVLKYSIYSVSKLRG